jgi:hypothetical protein
MKRIEVSFRMLGVSSEVMSHTEMNIKSSHYLIKTSFLSL